MEHPLLPFARSPNHAAPYGRFRRALHLLLVSLLALVLAPAPATAREQLVLALGDSLTAGYQLKPGQSFPAQLEAALRREGVEARVHNAGVSGDTSAQGRARLGWVLNSLKAKPDLAIVALGANDMLRGQPVPQMRANLDAILAEFHRRNIPVVLAGMVAPPNLGPAYQRDYNATFPSLARKHDATLYPFLLDGVVANRRLLLSDGMHPNAQGVAVMVDRMLPTVRRALAGSETAAR
jgi:acyl-CoA thioesterase-1